MSMRIEFSGVLIEWRGPSPFHFVPLTPQACDDVAQLADELSYGWGVVPVTVVVGRTEFTTSLIPRDGGYLLPVKDAVRRAEGLGLADEVVVAMRLGS
ncbi:MAG: DUF1905 domain-containing protein [Actinomycetes bacterium]